MIPLYEPPLPKRARLKSTAYKSKIPEPTLSEIINDVCFVFDKNTSSILSGNRKKELVKCKRIYAYVATVLTKKSCVKISKEINMRDHTSILYHVNTCLNGFKYNDEAFMHEWKQYERKSRIWGTYFKINLNNLNPFIYGTNRSS